MRQKKQATRILFEPDIDFSTVAVAVSSAVAIAVRK